jgi:hypothetical protein
MKQHKHPGRPVLRRLAIVLAAGALSLAAQAAHAVEMVWTATSYLTRMDQSTGEFARRGLAMFKDGEVVPFRIEGKLTSSEGNVQTYRTKIVYTFEDGSTLVQEGEGRSERQSAARNTQTGTGRFTAGTGRWEGVSGTTSSVGRGLTSFGDTFTEFKAEYSLPAK